MGTTVEMLTTRCNVTELVKVVKQNRDRHEELYNEAMIGYRKNIIDAINKKVENLKKRIVDVKEGKPVSHSVGYMDVKKPSNHTEDYDRVILMLEMTQDDSIVLNEEQFGKYAKDEWDWKSGFIAGCNPHGVTLNDMESKYLD
jgi:hypothetical protein